MHKITADCDAEAVWELEYVSKREKIEEDTKVWTGMPHPPYVCECGEELDTEDAAYQHLLEATEAER